MFNPRKMIRCAVLPVLLTVALRADEWPHYAGDPARSGIAARATHDFNHVTWSVTPVEDEEYVWRSSPVVYGGRVFVNACYFNNDTQVGNRVVAYDIFDGQRLWATPIEIGQFDSWASPAVDVRNQTVLLGSGYTLFALNMHDGEIVWQHALPRRIVNSSPVVSDDLFVGDTPTNRVYITDYTGFETVATLYAINVDPYDAIDNPYDPGDVVWTADLPGTSGNTPAYQTGTVYVSSIGGVVMALDAGDGTPLWETDADFAGYPQYSGFFGGITVRGGHVYAASYIYYGSGNNSGLFKFDINNGDIVWVAPCERTNSIPIVTDDGKIFLAAGLDGYGSSIKVQAFQDHGETVSQTWDTYIDTGGELIVGGWTYQPAYARGYLYVGTPDEQSAQFSVPCTDFYILDASRTPTDSGFIVDHYDGTGGSPAIADGTVYTLGQDGLFAFDPSPSCLADLDGNGTVDLADLATLLGAYGNIHGDMAFDSDADLNRDGTVDLSDLATLLGVYGAYCE